MQIEELKSIYDQLDKISVHIEPRSIPNPRYISEKIGECHVCIEQVEKIYIKTNRELSLLQIAMNNALAAFEFARNELIANDEDIKTLPSDRTKEAKANTRLSNQITELSNYKKDISSLETLIKTLSVKMKNLSRLNGDIRLQMRIMESQIKLGTGDINDPTTKNLMDELKKTVLGQDVWEGADTKSEESLTVDPSKPLDAKTLGIESDPMDAFLKTVEDVISTPSVTPDSTSMAFTFNTPPIQSTGGTAPALVISDPLMVDLDLTDPIVNISEPYTHDIEPMKLKPASSSFDDLLKGFEDEPIQPLTTKPLVGFSKLIENGGIPLISQLVNTPQLQETPQQPPKTLEETVAEDEDAELLPEDDLFAPGSPEAEITESQATVDLDKVLNFSNPISGGEQEQKIEAPIIKESEPKMTQEEQKNPNQMSLESLLGQFK